MRDKAINIIMVLLVLIALVAIFGDHISDWITYVFHRIMESADADIVKNILM